MLAPNHSSSTIFLWSQVVSGSFPGSQSFISRHLSPNIFSRVTGGVGLFCWVPIICLPSFVSQSFLSQSFVSHDLSPSLLLLPSVPSPFYFPIICLPGICLGLLEVFCSFPGSHQSPIICFPAVPMVSDFFPGFHHLSLMCCLSCPVSHISFHSLSLVSSGVRPFSLAPSFCLPLLVSRQ